MQRNSGHKHRRRSSTEQVQATQRPVLVYGHQDENAKRQAPRDRARGPPEPPTRQKGAKGGPRDGDVQKSFDARTRSPHERLSPH